MGTRLLHRFLIPTYSVLYRATTHKLMPAIETTYNARAFTVTPIYAKSKDRGKDKKNKNAKVVINPLVMSELVSVEKIKGSCSVFLDKMKEDYTKSLSIRSSTGAIESLAVRFEGNEYELQELAQIIKKNPKTLVINFTSFPQAIPDVLKAINASGLNLNPQQDGTTLFVPVPKVTKEHRESLARHAKILYIKCRDSIKDIENEYLRKAKKKTGVSEDLIFDVQRQITALCGEYRVEAKNIYDTKCKELVGGK